VLAQPSLGWVGEVIVRPFYVHSVSMLHCTFPHIRSRECVDATAPPTSSRSARALSGANCFLRALGEQPVIDDPAQGGANNWGYPEQPQLPQCPPSYK